MAETLTVTEAAADAGITRYAVWVAIKRGRLAATKRGRDWHIERAEWERYKQTSRKLGTIDTGNDTGKGVTTGSGDADLAHQDDE